MFLDTAIGYPGSMHDAPVLRNSELFRKVENGNILREPVVNINGNDIRPLLLRDGAYPLLPWLLKPYPNNTVLNPTQRRFNKVLSSARVTVELAFGVQKGDGEFRLREWITGLSMYRKLSSHAAFYIIFVKKQEKNLTTRRF